jgi:energy-coupling factor transporter ATP-binding protein EcfA2
MSPDFQSYLKHSMKDASRRQQSFYISTDAIEKPQLKLMVQKVAEKKPNGQPEEKVSPVPVLEGVRAFCAEHRHVLLVGRPGSGKSTALNQLLMAEAKRALENSALPIPVLVQLKSDQPILELIRKALRRGKLRLDESVVEDLLFEGNLLLLLDGINEIPRLDLQQALQEFREDNLDVPMIFTTRDLASGGYLGIEKQLEIQPLTPSQLRDFVGQSFPEQSAEFLNQLSDRLKELGETPLLLEMLCEVFRRTGEIPENLGLVFREFTQHYEQNLKEGVRIESDRELWKLVLQHLAWVMMQGEKPTEFRVAISREEAVGAIGQFLNEKFPYEEARKYLRDLEKHHLIQAGTKLEELEFRHQLIQEYYAAEKLLQQLPRLKDGQLKEFLNYLKWTEPLVLMLALMDDMQALQVVTLAIEVDLMLGAKLAGKVSAHLQNHTVELLNCLDVQLIGNSRRFGESEKQFVRVVDRRTLTQSLRDEFFEQFPEIKKLVELGLIVELPHFSDALRVRLLTLSGSKAAIPKLAEALEKSVGQKNPDIRDAAIIGLVKNSSISEGSILVNLFLRQEDFREDLIRILVDTATESSNKILESILESCPPQTLSELSDFISERLHLRAATKQFDEVNPFYLEEQQFSSNEVRALLYQLSEFGKNGNEISIEILIDTLKDTETPAMLRSDSLDALRRIKNHSQVALAVFEMLDDELCECVSGVHASVLDGVGELGNGTMLIPLFEHVFYRLGNIEVCWDGEWDAILKAIASIQSRCGYYNYEIYQAYLEAQKNDRQINQNGNTDTAIADTITIQTIERLIIMTDKGPIFNQENATIGVNYAAEGSKQEFTQHANSSEQNFEILLTDYIQFIDELQQKHPKLSDANAVPQIIEVEAKLIEAQDKQRWQNFLNLKRLWKGGKKAGVKVGEHFAENNVWAKGAIAFLEGVSEDLK